jgi:hypothetical protein
MTRSIRTGTGYCENGGNCSSAFYFTDDLGNVVTYSLVNGAIERDVTQTGGPAEASGPITDAGITIGRLAFTFVPADPDIPAQGHVLIVVQGSVVTGPGKTQTFSIETSATERTLEVAAP